MVPTEQDKDKLEQTPAEKAKTDAAVTSAGGVTGKKAPPLGSDPRPEVVPSETSTPESAHKAAKPGRLGDGGPSSDASGKNQGNLREEENQPPTQNATAAGPDGQTPANAPGMSHGM